MFMPHTIQSIARKEVPLGKKKEFFEKEVRSGKQKVFKGLQQIKKNIGDPKAFQGIIKVRQGHQQIRFAKRNLSLLKKKRFFK